MVEQTEKRTEIVRRMLAEEKRRKRIASRILTQELGWKKDFPIPLTCCNGLHCSSCDKCRYEEIVKIIQRNENCIWVVDEIDAMHLILDGHELITNSEILKERERYIADPQNKEKYPFWYKSY